MARYCDVCSMEQSKYKCPTCGVLSCSLSCTQSHKIYCTPNTTSELKQNRFSAPSSASIQEQSKVNGIASEDKRGGNRNAASLEALGASKGLEAMLSQYPVLREKLREIYRITLEEEWLGSYTSDPNRGLNGRKGGYHRGEAERRGTWTAEKGFGRGMEMVRRLREGCEDGLITGPAAEGILRFFNFINGEQEESALLAAV